MTEYVTPKDKRVLLVDDDAFVLAVYSSKLKKAGLDVEAAVDGAEALHKLETVRPHLVLLDLNMPRLNGIEVLKYIRNTPMLAEIPVIVLSNACTDEIVRETWAARPTRFFIKRDTTPNAVVEEVQALLSSPTSVDTKAPPIVEPAPSERTVEEERQTLVNERLRQVLAVPDEAESFREAVLNLYQVLQPWVRQCRAEPAVSFAAIFGGALEALFEEFYAQPLCATPSSLRALAMGVERLQSAFVATGVRMPAFFESALVLVIAEDVAIRRSMGKIFRAPLFHAMRVGDADLAVSLMEENEFDAVVIDVESEARWLKRIRSAPGGQNCPILFLVEADEYRSTLVAGHERVAKPVLAADLYLKTLLLIERRRMERGTITPK